MTIGNGIFARNISLFSALGVLACAGADDADGGESVANGTGGQVAAVGGSVAGTGGATTPAGTGGAAAGTGGATTPAGAGGDVAGAGGDSVGTGGAAAGVGGSDGVADMKACSTLAESMACIDFTGPGATSASVAEACPDNLAASCPAGAYGTCTLFAGMADEIVAYYYDGNAYAEADCTAGTGVWAVP